MSLVVLSPSMESVGFGEIKSCSSSGVNELIVAGHDVFNLMDLSKNWGLGFISIMRNINSRERIGSGNFVLSSFSSQNNGGRNNTLMMQDSFNVLFGSSHFGGNESSGFRGNI